MSMYVENSFNRIYGNMPCIVQSFFCERPKLNMLTKLEYLRDIQALFQWLLANDILKHNLMSDVTIQDLNDLTLVHFIQYIAEVKSNYSISSLNRKIGSLRSFFTYLYKCDDKDGGHLLKRNFMSRFHKEGGSSLKDIASRNHGMIFRNDFEREKFLEFALNKYSPTSKKGQSSYRINKERDIAILSLFLLTGIRLNELESIDVPDIELEKNQITIWRNKLPVVVKIECELKVNLLSYLEVRESNYNLQLLEKAFFVSNRAGLSIGQRISSKTILNIVKRYCSSYGLPELSPRRLRHSFGAIEYIDSERVKLGDHMGISIERTEVYRLLSSENK